VFFPLTSLPFFCRNFSIFYNYLSLISVYFRLSSDVWLYNRLTLYHEFHMLDKASKDKVKKGSTSGVKMLLQLLTKRQWCWGSVFLIVLLSRWHVVCNHVLVKVKKSLAKMSQPRLRGTRVRHLSAGMICKTMMMMMILCKNIMSNNCQHICKSSFCKTSSTGFLF